MMLVRIAALAACLGLAPTIASARAQILHAARGWAALDHGAVCEARARAQRIAAKDKVQATAGFAFSASSRRWGEFGARLSRVPRPGSSILLTIGDQPFLLTGRGDWAWATGPVQDRAILEAVRGATGMRIEARDQAGRRFTDRYMLAGAPTAIDSAAARCAGKTRRK